MKKALILPLLIFILVGYSEAAKKTVVKGLRFSSYKNYTRVVVDLNGSVNFSKQRIKNPERIFFDLKNCALSKKLNPSLTVGGRILRKIRAAQYDRDTVRVVIDLKKSKNYYAFLLENPYRLVIDVYKGNGKTAPVKKKPVKKLKDKKIPETITVVIDPGHGGKDPGAIGPRGLREKDINLSVAKKLGRLLKKKGMKVIYTRTRDVFIPLNDRTEMANSKKADIFISIHVNASERRNTRGIETYFLNWTNNREAIRVAARENRISFKKMKKLQDELQFILHDLARNSKREESMKLADSVQSAMVRTLKKDYRRINDLGVKNAMFYVLIGAEMPSILAEISFISNREEEKRLSSDKYKNRIAEAIAKGIDSYMSQSAVTSTSKRKKSARLKSERLKVSGDNI